MAANQTDFSSCRYRPTIATAATASASGLDGFTSIPARRLIAGDSSSSLRPCWIAIHAFADGRLLAISRFACHSSSRSRCQSVLAVERRLARGLHCFPHRHDQRVRIIDAEIAREPCDWQPVRSSDPRNHTTSVWRTGVASSRAWALDRALRPPKALILTVAQHASIPLTPRDALQAGYPRGGRHHERLDVSGSASRGVHRESRVPQSQSRFHPAPRSCRVRHIPLRWKARFAAAEAAKKFRDDLESELAGIPPRCFQDDARTAQTSVCRPSSVYEVVKPAGFTAKVT